MAKYMLMGDLHLSDRPPSSCTDTYLDDIFGILEETVKLAGELRIDAVIWAGDVFHHKTPGRTTHKTVHRLIDLARTYPCKVYVVPGNHDMLNDRFDSLDETQPLGVVLASGAVELLYHWMLPTERLDKEGWLDPVYGVPWLMHFDDMTVSEALCDFREDPEEEYPHHLVVAHAPLYPPGQELKYEFYPTAQWATAMGGTGSVYYGHVHEPHGIYDSNGVTFCNAGAISRGSLHEHNLTREVSVAIWDSETGLFEIVPVPHKPASEVFRLQEVGEATTAQLKLDGFLSSIGQARISITSIESVMEHLRTLDLDEDLVAVAHELLREAQ